MDHKAVKALLDQPGGHPVTGTFSDNDAEAAVQLSVKNIERPVESVSGQALFEAVVPSEYNALTDTQQRLFLAIVGMGTIFVNGPNVKVALLSMFGPVTSTRTNLAALQTELVSVAVDLGAIREGHVQQARAI